MKSSVDPSEKICGDEFRQLFLNFCTLMCLLHNKKLNLANIFLLLLKDSRIKRLYMRMCDFDTDFEALKSFLETDSTLHKSKYIKKYLNSRQFKATSDKFGKNYL